MKHPFCGLAWIIVATCLWSLSPAWGAESGPLAGKEAVLEKEAVAKVFSAHRFTPPVPLAGSPGLTWYVGARSLTEGALAQIIVGVHRGAHFTVEVSTFRRSREDEPWVAVSKGSEANLITFERAVRDQLRKELALEEKPR